MFRVSFAMLALFALAAQADARPRAASACANGSCSLVAVPVVVQLVPPPPPPQVTVYGCQGSNGCVGNAGGCTGPFGSGCLGSRAASGCVGSYGAGCVGASGGSGRGLFAKGGLFHRSGDGLFARRRERRQTSTTNVAVIQMQAAPLCAPAAEKRLESPPGF